MIVTIQVLKQLNNKSQSPIRNQRQVIGLLVALGMIPLSMCNYKHDKHKNLEDNVQKIKVDLFKYYESFAKNLSDKLTQDLLSTLEIEERQFNNTNPNPRRKIYNIFRYSR